MLLGGFDAEVLVDAGEFFCSTIEEDKVVDQFQNALLIAEFEQIFVEFVVGILLFVFFPGEEVFLFGADGAVAKSFGIIASKDELDGAEEGLNKFGLLVNEALADAIANGDAAIFKL